MHWNRHAVQESLDARLLAGKQASYLPEARDEGDARHTPEDAGGARTAGSSLYVALVGHEHQQADQLARLLTQQGFQVGVFDAWPERASAAGVDLIVLDLGDAAADQGVELIARVRSQVSNMPPILALTVAAAESDLASLYDAGADDVMFKPCASRCSRRACRHWRGASIRARSSRQTCSESALMPSTAARRLSLNGQSVKLSSREFDLALYLFRNVGRLVSRATLEKGDLGQGVGRRFQDGGHAHLPPAGQAQIATGKRPATGQRVCAGFSPDPGGDAVLSKPRPVLDRAVRDRMNQP